MPAGMPALLVLDIPGLAIICTIKKAFANICIPEGFWGVRLELLVGDCRVGRHTRGKRAFTSFFLKQWFLPLVVIKLTSSMGVVSRNGPWRVLGTPSGCITLKACQGGNYELRRMN
jgi:hypothetical protein